MRTEVAAIVAVYFAALLGWGLYTFVRGYRLGGGTLEERYVGTRSFGTGALVATLVAAWASNYTLLAAAESGFRYGLSGPIWYALGVGLPILFFIWPINLVRRIRESMVGGVTLVEYVGRRYDGRTRFVALVVVLLSSVLYIISVILAIGIVLSSLLGIDARTATIIGGVVLILYTALGGFEAQVWSHVYQLVLAGLSVAVALVLTVRRTGLGDFVDGVRAERADVLAWGPVQMADFFLVLTALTIASPVIWQRIFSARDERSATRAVAWFAPTWIPFAIGSGLMGIAAAQLLPALNPSEAATGLVVELFPTWAAVLFLLGGMALVFSSGDATINNVASIVHVDIVRNYFRTELSARGSLYLSFGLQLGLGLVGILGALTFTSILNLLVINSAVNIALIFPLYLGLVWRNASSSGAFWSILVSLVVGGTLIVLDAGPVANLVALVLSVVVIVGLSHLRPATGRRELGRPAVGALVAVGLYAAIYAVATAAQGVDLPLPGGTLYLLLAYALLGTIGMFTVLPVLALRGQKEPLTEEREAERVIG
jgi:Na+/proline symporter